MQPIIQRPRLGVDFRSGKRAPTGYMLRARNSRYLPGDGQDRLWALLGRSIYNVAGIPNAALPAPDTDVMKTLFSFYDETGTPKLCVHRGGAIFEGTLAATGIMTEAFQITSTGTTPRGVVAPYQTNLYYPVGLNNWSSTRHFLTRTLAGWRLGGFRTPTTTFSLTPGGSGSFASTTDVKYTYRLYDSTTDTESFRGPIVTVAPFTGKTQVDVQFASPGVVPVALGTHLRIYRTLLSESAGVYYRVDGAGDGIPIASVITGYTFPDTTTNTDAQINGTVRADGEEGTAQYAEHGGPPPPAGGGVIFKDHLVLWDVVGQPTRIYYSAEGYPEVFPVNFDGAYQYYLPATTTKQDRILRCIVAGGYLLAFGKQAITRFHSLPTYSFPGFERKIQDLLTEDHGICGRYAVDNFGMGGTEESLQAVYVSREHGIQLTNGMRAEPILQQSDWRNLVAQAYLPNVVVRNYPWMQELWIYYTPQGGTANTQALIVDYSKMGEKYGGVRLSGPIDVRATDSAFAWGNDHVGRMYQMEPDSDLIYVQDQGSVDAQDNTNEDGDIALDWETTRVFPLGTTKKVAISRAFVSGVSGTAKTFTAEARVVDGTDEYTIHETVQLGPGEVTDQFLVNAATPGIRTRLSYTGPTGSDYDEDSANCAPCFASIELEAEVAGRQARTRTA